VVLTQTAPLSRRDVIPTGVLGPTVAPGAILPYGRIVEGSEMARGAIIASGFGMRWVVWTEIS
jgi:hypothetical protein